MFSFTLKFSKKLLLILVVSVSLGTLASAAGIAHADEGSKKSNRNTPKISKKIEKIDLGQIEDNFIEGDFDLITSSSSQSQGIASSSVSSSTYTSTTTSASGANVGTTTS